MPNNHKIVITGLTEKQKQILLNVLRDAEASGAINFFLFVRIRGKGHRSRGLVARPGGLRPNQLAQIDLIFCGGDPLTPLFNSNFFTTPFFSGHQNQ